MRFLVKALVQGYYNHQRVKPGKNIYLKGDALKYEKVLKEGKLVVTDRVVFPQWVKPLEKYSQDQLKKALKEFLAVKEKKVVDDEPPQDPEGSELNLLQGDQGVADGRKAAEQEVI